MASSEKAGALKNAFVNAIANELGGEAMAQAGAMENAKLAGKLGLDVGDQASKIYDLKRNQVRETNDGIARATVIDTNDRAYSADLSHLSSGGGAENSWRMPAKNSMFGQFLGYSNKPGHESVSDMNGSELNAIRRSLERGAVFPNDPQSAYRLVR